VEVVVVKEVPVEVEKVVIKEVEKVKEVSEVFPWRASVVTGSLLACRLTRVLYQVPVERVVTKEVEKIVYVDKPIEIEKIKEVVCVEGLFLLSVFVCDCAVTVHQMCL